MGPTWEEVGNLQDPSLHSLGENLKTHVLHSKEKSTVNKYTAAFRRWEAWANRYPEITSLPAKPVHVAAYFSNLAKSGKFSAVESAFYGISWAHNVANLPDPTDHALPRQTKEGLKRRLGKPVRTRLPIPYNFLVGFAEKANSTKSQMDLRLATMCCVAYGGFLRYDDLAPLQVRDIYFGNGHIEVNIKKSKTDVYSEGDKVLVAASGKITCPVGLLQQYYGKVGIVASTPPDTYVFRAISGSGSKAKLRKINKPLSYSRARELLKEALRKAGQDASLYGLHSLRIGGTSSAARAGIDHTLLKAHGRWKSEAAKDLYVRYSEAQRMEVSLATGV